MDIVVIGSGRVATHLAQAIDKVANVIQAYSPTMAHAQQLCAKLRNCQPVDDMNNVNRDADLFLIMASDDAILSIVRDLGHVDGAVAHTSGSASLDSLRDASANIGVFYPLQTFTKETPVDMSKVTIFTEASNDATLQILDSLAIKIAKGAQHASSSQRRQLHIAAVFACNFTNHLWTIADDVLKAAGYDFDVLEPLLRATLDKALAIGPRAAQTGPAARKDTNVINSHLASLDGTPHKIYLLLSNSILSCKL